MAFTFIHRRSEEQIEHERLMKEREELTAAETRARNIEYYGKWRETAPEDARGVRLVSPNCVADPGNAALLEPVKLREAKHYKNLEDVKNVMSRIKEDVADEIATTEDAMAELRETIQEEAQAKEKAYRKGELVEVREHAHGIEELKEELETLGHRLDMLKSRPWYMIEPEDVVALYESLAEITEPELGEYEADIAQLEAELAEAKAERAELIRSRRALWRDFYNNVLNAPEFYTARENKDGTHTVINLAAGIIPQEPYKSSLYTFLREYENGVE